MSKKDDTWEDLLAEHGLRNAFQALQVAGIRCPQDLVAASEGVLDGLELKIVTRRKLLNCRSSLGAQISASSTRESLYLPFKSGDDEASAAGASSAAGGTPNTAAGAAASSTGTDADTIKFYVEHSRHYWIDLDEADWKVETLKEITEHFTPHSVIVYVNNARTAKDLKEKLEAETWDTHLPGSVKSCACLTPNQSDAETQAALASFQASKATRPNLVVPNTGPACLISTFDQAKKVHQILNPRGSDPATYPLFAILYDIPATPEQYYDATSSPGLARAPEHVWQWARRVIINFWGGYAPEDVKRIRRELSHLKIEALPVHLDLLDLGQPQPGGHGHPPSV